jgi:hypothetical protein
MPDEQNQVRAEGQPDPPGGSPQARRRWRLWAFGVGLGAPALLAGVLLGLRWSGARNDPKVSLPPPDPRLGYAGPFLNVHPDVRYVGDARCGECHPSEAENFRRHPMGRSLLPVARMEDGPGCATAQHNPFEALGLTFLLRRRGNRLDYRETRLDAGGKPVVEIDVPLHYAIGSGNHGHSFLTERDGALFQAPVSWFAGKKIWDLSPGFDESLGAGRPVSPECLFCHANRVRHVEGTANRYQRPIFDGHAIGCERCHGPAERHLRAGRPAEQEGVDYTIVNPRHLAPDLRDAVCEQCHLEGEARVRRYGRGLYDYRPGLPLQEFWAVFVAAGHDHKAVNHVEQMRQSKCFRAGQGDKRMGCISCHDPHRRVRPAARLKWYRRACLKCHTHRPCSVPPAVRRLENKDDSCIACHMPPFESSDVVHHAATDHRIVRRIRRAAGPAAAEGTGPVLESFYPTEGGNEARRDLGLALVQMANRHPEQAGRSVSQALVLFDEVLPRRPDDGPAWTAKGWALLRQRRPREALACLEAVLRRSPGLEEARVLAAVAAERAGRLERALQHWRRAAEINPQLPSSRRGLARLLVQLGRWKDARRECDAWLRLEPASAEARVLRVRYHLHQGEVGKARKEFEVVEKLRPANLGALRAWFRDQAP